MGDELRGDSLVHLNVRFSTEAELKQTLDFLYEKSKEGIAFTGLVEAMVNEVTIITAIHNIKSNKGSKTAGVDRLKMDKYLQMPKEELIALIRDNFSNYNKYQISMEKLCNLPHRHEGYKSKTFAVPIEWQQFMIVKY